jgi:hypothetical protein
MDINSFRSLGRQAPKMAQRASQQVAEAQAQNQAQYLGQAVLPKDSIDVNSKGSRKGLSPHRLVADLKPEERSALGGGSALETIARVQPSLTIGEAQPLLNNKSALESIAGLMESRNDMRVSDFMSVDRKGKVRIDPSYKDPETMEFLKSRPDISPGQVTAMRANFTKKFKNPTMGSLATKKAFELMKKRTDMNPDDATELMNKIAKAAGVGGKGAKGADPAAAPAAALDMFDNASKLLQKRDDLKPDQVGQLATSVGALGSDKDKQKSGRVAEGFKSATKSLEDNPMRRPDELSEMANTIGEHFKGGDEKTSGFRMDAFKKSSKMLADNNNLDSKSVGNFLKQAKENDPKIKNAPPAKKAQLLAGTMDDLSSGLKSGKVSSNNLAQHFDNKKADADRGKINKNQGKLFQGVGDKPKNEQAPNGQALGQPKKPGILANEKGSKPEQSQSRNEDRGRVQGFGFPRTRRPG